MTAEGTLSATDSAAEAHFSDSFTDSSEGARNAAGWEMCLENLELVLQGVEAAVFVFEVWQGKFEKYVKKYEPEMGPQQGPPGMPAE